MAKCEVCGHNKRKNHENSPSHRKALKEKGISLSKPKTSGLETRISAMEKQIHTIFSEMNYLTEKVDKLTKKKRSIAINKSVTKENILESIRIRGGREDWVEIDSIFESISSDEKDFNDFEKKVIELTDENIVELGEGAGKYRIKSRGDYFGLVKII